MKEITIRHLNWVNRLVERMQSLGFPPHDGMFDAAVRARNALQDLHMSAHYAGENMGAVGGRMARTKGTCGSREQRK